MCTASLVAKGSFLDMGGVWLLGDTGLTTSTLTRSHPRTSNTEQPGHSVRWSGTQRAQDGLGGHVSQPHLG